MTEEAPEKESVAAPQEEVPETENPPPAEEAEEKAPPPIFLSISPDAKPIEMESLCMQCMENGMTTMLLTRIPFFREIMISRFECPHCGYSDRRVDFAGTYPPKGVHYELTVSSPEDLCRRTVKSRHGVVKIPELDFEIPGETQGDSISTVEGVLDQAVRGLLTAPQTPEMQRFLEDLKQCAKGLVQFTFTMDDPSGNSFIENPLAPKPDPSMKVSFYKRTKEQTEAIGLMASPPGPNIELDADSEEHINSVFAEDSRVMTVPAPCPVCSTEGEMRSCTLNIPHFKEIVIMAFNCQQCSYHSGEVTVGGEISPQARRVTLKAAGTRDLERELLKSETAALRIPECDFELVPGTLGGKFTTVEGILVDIKKSLVENNPFVEGDSAPDRNVVFEKLVKTLDDYVAGQPFTLIMEDPLSNSYIQVYDDDEPGKMVIEDYDRTAEEDDMLGITDMKTEAKVTENGVEYVKPEIAPPSDT